MIRALFFAIALLPPTRSAHANTDRFSKLADTYVEAVEKANADHARKPGKKTEPELAQTLSKKAQGAVAKLLGEKSDDADSELAGALERCARAALDLDRVEDFEALRTALAAVAPEQAESLGVAHSEERFLLLGEGGLGVDYLEGFATVLNDVLGAYDEVFGFQEFSKVPGKKLRVRLRLVEAITRPPHFAPQFPYHSEIDFPVIADDEFRSPTDKGQFLFYGLCHELGHVIAMWGNQSNEEDHHAWAHYTGLVIVEHLATRSKPPAWIDGCKDARWRSLTKERERLIETTPGRADRDGILALLVSLHDAVGPQALGKAINALDEKDTRLRINRVRYYSFRELEKALLGSLESRKDKKAVEALFELQ